MSTRRLYILCRRTGFANWDAHFGAVARGPLNGEGPFTIPGETPVSSEPGEGTLDDPAARQDDKNPSCSSRQIAGRCSRHRRASGSMAARSKGLVDSEGAADAGRRPIVCSSELPCPCKGHSVGNVQDGTAALVPGIPPFADSPSALLMTDC
jgi:hypothetical protein